jgi:glyoxylase-like metal-dependent hydrolase (beta-lactamase superfamily II)
MKIKMITYNSGWLGSNSYVLINEENEAIIIDAGAEANFYFAKALKENFKIKYVLLTHGHFDHATAGKRLQDGGIKIGISEKDYDFLYTDKNLSNGINTRFEQFKADFTFKDNDILTLCGITIKVILTPGHTHGSVCFLIGDMLFSGDTLFLENIGRTDFPTGNYKEIIDSIKNKLLILNDDITVYTGHGETTTIFHEKKYNPFAGGTK